VLCVFYKNGLNKGDALSPLLFNFALDCAIRRVQINQEGLELNGTHQLLGYAGVVNILGGSIHTVKENAEALVVGCKEIGLEVNVDKTKYMVMSGDQNAGRSHDIKNDNISFERVEQFKYLGTNLLTYLLTPRCRVLLEKLTGVQLVKKFSGFHGTRRFITALKSARHLSVS